MPTFLVISGFRFFFYSNENDEPIHVHIIKGDASGKIWLEPGIVIAYLKGFNKREENRIIEIINEHAENFKQKWHEHFAQ